MSKVILNHFQWEQQQKDILFEKIINLLDVSKKKLKLVDNSFNKRPEIYFNLSDKIVSTTLICLIKLIDSETPGYSIIGGYTNKKYNFRDYYEKYNELGDFEMSSETKKRFKENLKIFQKNQT